MTTRRAASSAKRTRKPRRSATKAPAKPARASGRTKSVRKKATSKAAEAPLLILTIGHSTRAIEEFTRMLQGHGVQRVIDVRSIPRSRHNPQFNRDTLPQLLRPAGIAYTHAPALGGLRRTTSRSINTGWRNASFRGYADYMQTPEFARAIEQLIEDAKRERVALMCAEAVPWRCHRSMIADALLVRGVNAEDIASPTRRTPHRLTPFAKVRGTRITYPPSRVAARKTKTPAAKK